MNRGLTMLEIRVETENGDLYGVGIDREKTVVFVPLEDKWYPLISSGPIAIGYELRGIYKKRNNEYTFESLARLLTSFSCSASKNIISHDEQYRECA